MRATIIEVDEHLRLKPFTSNDAEALYDLLSSNRDAGKWLPWVSQVTRPDPEYLAGNAVISVPGRRTTFGIYLDSALVGQIEFDPQDKSAAPGTGSIGYLLDKKHFAKGIATRACASVIDYAFNDMGLAGMEIHCRQGNGPSVRLAQRLGFQGGKPSERVDGQLLFTLTPELWHQQQKPSFYRWK